MQKVFVLFFLADISHKWKEIIYVLLLFLFDIFNRFIFSLCVHISMMKSSRSNNNSFDSLCVYSQRRKLCSYAFCLILSFFISYFYCYFLRTNSAIEGIAPTHMLWLIGFAVPKIALNYDGLCWIGLLHIRFFPLVFFILFFWFLMI